ncbi:hypothetical protein D9611_003011 [Ephemerocybe angulata]|uniref:F-box domain-containing protein n=1 Tax=Ephemerocybe angulata TaxID=980116 RepID=A0A8H5C8H6_9AGAR|nr:hypothetical protein D9611_003011 [Tulosesus angulatus]
MASSTSAGTGSTQEMFFGRREILNLIFKIFVPVQLQATTAPDTTSSSLEWRKQLLNLSLVSRAFSDPALDCLWTHLDSLTPLLKLHPGMRDIDGLYYFIGDIDDPKAARFHRYARAVRSIAFNAGGNTTHPISLAGMSWLGQQLKGRALLPGLQRVQFKDPNCDSVHMGLLPLILSPSIETVGFDGSFLSANTFHTYSLPIVCGGAPQLKHLLLEEYGVVSHTGIWGSLPTILRPLQRLESLTLLLPNTLSMPTAFLYQLIPNLRNITSLYLDTHTGSHSGSWNSVFAFGGTGELQCLTSLELVNRSGPNVCPCYPASLLKRATSMVFHISTSLTGSNQSRQAIETLSTMKNLKTVKIVPRTREVVIAPDNLKGFLRSLSLETFEIRGGTLFAENGVCGGGLSVLIDAAYAQDGEGTIRRPLRSLHTPIWRHTYHFPPIRTLVDIARNAIGLHHLSLCIDSTWIGPNNQTLKSLMETWEEPAVPSTLRHLEIADFRTSNFEPAEYRDLARLLDTIFPNLESLTMIDHDPTRDKKWDEHWKLIEEYRRMRRSLRIHGLSF